MTSANQMGSRALLVWLLDRLFLQTGEHDEVNYRPRDERCDHNADETVQRLLRRNFHLFFRRSTQISHARRADEPILLNNGAMLSADDISESGEIKGVAAVAPGSALPYFPMPNLIPPNRIIAKRSKRKACQ
jgi:hypothetical protein